jgi:HK97 family phage portal protein
VQGRVFQIQEIARFYRYPLHKLQELSKAPSYNSLEQFNLEFVNDTLMPWSILWEQEINRKLFVNPKDQNKYVKFNFNALLRGDSAGRASFYRTMIMAGIMSRNEARILEELEPIDGADKLLEPLNMRGVGTERQLDAQERGGD